MPTATLEALEQRIIVVEQEVARLKQPKDHEQKPLPSLMGNPGSRDWVLATMAKIKPISQETADMINNAIQEAREQSIADTLSS